MKWLAVAIAIAGAFLLLRGFLRTKDRDEPGAHPDNWQSGDSGDGSAGGSSE